jgi:hypothetical protein
VRTRAADSSHSFTALHHRILERRRASGIGPADRRRSERALLALFDYLIRKQLLALALLRDPRGYRHWIVPSSNDVGRRWIAGDVSLARM